MKSRVRKKNIKSKKSHGSVYRALFVKLLSFIFSKIGAIFSGCLALIFFAYYFFSNGYSKKIADDFNNLFFSSTEKVGFYLKDVVVFGRYRTKKEEILKKINAEHGRSIFKYNVDSVKSKIEEIEWVKTAIVKRNLCGALYVHIIEKEPIAIYYDKKQDKFILVDNFGDLINQPIANCFRGLPIITGEKSYEKIPKFLEKINKFKNVRTNLTALACVNGRRWNLKLNNSVEVKMPEENLDETLKIVDILIEQGKISSGDIKAIDLRLNEKIIIKLSQSGVDYFKLRK